jgi:hypothetical protein
MDKRVNKTYVSENNFYSLKYPESFLVHQEDNVVTIFPENDQSALTISSYYVEKGVDDAHFQEVFESITKGYTVEGEKVELNENIWIQQFSRISDQEKVIWNICLNRNGNVLLIITLNFGEGEDDEIINQYQEIFQSIQNHGAE